jgi:hypothetical protein
MNRTHYKKWRQQASEYLGQWDLMDDTGALREATVVIASVVKFQPRIIRKRKQPDGTYQDEPNKRYEITFVGKRKKWLAGPVSQDAIAAMHGQYIEEWLGKKLRLYVDPNVEMGGRRVGGIRVRPTPPSDAPTADPLDRPIDDAAAERIEQARADAGFLDADEKEAAQ